MNNKNQICSHPSFYTMNNSVYCNPCHKYLGYFDYVIDGFVKKTSDTIENEYLNKRKKEYRNETVKI